MCLAEQSSPSGTQGDRASNFTSVGVNKLRDQLGRRDCLTSSFFCIVVRLPFSRKIIEIVGRLGIPALGVIFAPFSTWTLRKRVEQLHINVIRLVLLHTLGAGAFLRE